MRNPNATTRERESTRRATGGAGRDKRHVRADENYSSVWFASGFNRESNLRLRTIPATGLHNPEEISKFFHREIAELQSSGEEACEVTLALTVGDSAASTTERRVVTLKIDGDGGRMV